MKTSNASPSQLSHENLALLRQQFDRAKLPTSVTGVALLIADMCDEIAQGKDVYMIISSTRNKSAFSLSVKAVDAPEPIYADSFAELSVAAAGLL